MGHEALGEWRIEKRKIDGDTQIYFVVVVDEWSGYQHFPTTAYHRSNLLIMYGLKHALIDT